MSQCTHKEAMAKIVVLGAGVSGLTSALSLLQLFPEQIQELTILSSELPGDYHAHDFTSPWAGANWQSFAKHGNHAQIQRDKLTYTKFEQLAATEPESGVKTYRLKLINRKENGAPWFIEQNFVKDIEYLSDEEMKFRNADPEIYRGFEFTSFTVTPVVYCSYLLSKIKKLGGKVQRIGRLSDISDVIDAVGYKPTFVVNCTGVNAGKLLSKLDPDELSKVHPVKGQILQIYEELPFQLVIDMLPEEDNGLPNQFLNIFPRGEGGCIVGGIMTPGDWSKTIDPKLSEKILSVCKRHVPELKSMTVYNSYAALRPGRTEGVRIELSSYDLPRGEGKLDVVHNYGIAGAGYQSSYGSAMEVCLLASRILGSPRGTCPFKL